MSSKYYLIFGGSTGIGFCASRKIVEQGNRVILVSSNKKKLEDAAFKLGGNASYFVCNLKNTEEVHCVFDYIKDNRIMLSGMVYAAGVAPLCLLSDNSVELMQSVFSVNFYSFVEAVKYFQQQNISYEGSSIVAVSPITAKGAGYRQMLYGSSKAAMIASVKLMAKELLNRNIHINCISPGVTDTAMLDDLRHKSENLDAKIKNSQCLGVLKPETIANEILWLIGEGAVGRTGMEIIVDGGATLK